MASMQVIPEEVIENAVLETLDVTTPVRTSPVAGRTERAAGFEIVISPVALFAVYRIKGGKDD